MYINGGGFVALAASAGHVLLLVHRAAAKDALPDLTCPQLQQFICLVGMTKEICEVRNWELANKSEHFAYMKQCAPGSSPGDPGASELECSALEHFTCSFWMQRDYCHLLQREDEGCQNTRRPADEYMRKCHPSSAKGLATHCERVATQADWCEKTFRAWVSQHDLGSFCRDGDCTQWWKRMDLGHWVRDAKLPRHWDEEPQTKEGREDLNRRRERAFAMTAREWRVMFMNQADPKRDLSLMSTPDWMRRMALTLEEDVEAGKKLDDSPAQYAYAAKPTSESGADSWPKLEKAAADAWRNRLLKLEELAVYRPPSEDYSGLNWHDPVWEAWKSTALNMTRA
ncbi:hypothetical protein HRG_001108 [Hirsutella rhossiliensis]|uniref:Uncharacterized protein n=1 Tax=Hirsutella rhossiliensis TaxID=111463 RepID=A0A9P8SPQ8_9HYPO|nr:uncharacterized protein HRG_01108 [Hirsutella rhossiliensis]KAH0968466.1 hypothetical protein HRG_01108 [Hirsutella rhossiliensis]